MSDSVNWFSRMLSGGQQRPQQAPPQQYQQQPPPQQYQQQPPPQYAQQQPVQYQQQPQYYQQQPVQGQEDESWRQQFGHQALNAIKQGQAGLSAITGLFRGSKQVRQQEHENCPNCNDVRYFTRNDPSMMKMNSSGQMIAPASICMACGYTPFHGADMTARPVDSNAPVLSDAHSAKMHSQNQWVGSEANGHWAASSYVREHNV